MNRRVVILGAVLFAMLLCVGATSVSAQSTGEKVWEQDEVSEPVVIEETGDTIYIVSDSNHLVALDRDTGGIKWQRQLPDGDPDYRTEMEIADDTIFIKVLDPSSAFTAPQPDLIFAFDRSGNGLKWSAEFDDSLSESSISATERGLVLYKHDSIDPDQIITFNSTTGQREDSIAVNINDEPTSGIAFSSDHVAVANDTTVVIIDTLTGEMVSQQRYGTVGLIDGGDKLSVIAGSDPVANEFTSHLITYNISTQERIGAYDFPYDDSKASEILKSNQMLLVDNSDDGRILGYNLTAEEQVFDIAEDTGNDPFKTAFTTNSEYFLASNSFRDLETGEKVASIDDSINLLTNSGHSALTNDTAVVWGTDFDSAADESVIGIQAPSQTGSPPPVLSNSPTDPDGDGEFEDVNGDGRVSVLDVQALFVNLDRDSVQNHTSAYDFNDDGRVSIVDVQALFQES